MSLVVEVRINDEPVISLVTALRISHVTEHPQPYDVVTYNVRRYDRISGSMSLVDETEIAHKYGGGAVKLAAKMLEALT